ncbi:MAG: tyrosine-type recombinase/integrase [Devosia sp.]|jgi:integrase|uniref:tyrosine-type recombinase/integrase n=1 Tax=Alphaproteobacteria TaxID=28211 RepID=UPI001AD164E1|nr:site-specific integrase [Devosia sp.]MBN9317642.1 tyrosine-type recombinase/integrase [Devosia sp.]MCB1445509.1 tyrosine-type recombinase/integrase [Rhizobiaceae bacterium]MCC0008991.1 tyrosine-type recombinase/integrase [Hyphomicrobiaceae bacterium]HRO00971.1 integrase arm-type DNA-binding domain-containing protein [Nitrobacter sp.]
MAKLTKRIVDAADVREKDYFVWDDELPGFGLRVFASGKRSYLIQYRAAGRTRRYTIGLHGVWTPETARQEAKVQLGRVARGDNPSEERQLDHKAITVKELCALYTADLNAGLILGKGGRPKKPTTIVTDTGRIERHIIPLIGARRVKDLTKADINKVLKDIMAGKTRVAVKTKKLRGKAIVRGGAGTATRTVGLLGGILTYAVDAGIIESNPAHGIKKPKDNVRNRRLTEAEYRTLGEMLVKAAENEKYAMTVEIIRQIALTGCRRSEMISLMWIEADTDASCMRLVDSKEGESIRPIGLPVVDFLEERRKTATGTYVFPGQGEDNAFGSFPNHWEQIFKDSPLADVTPHVLRHSFASIANDLGFTEVTIAALVGHSKGSVTSKYIHTLDTALIMAADTISGYIQGLLEGIEFKQTAYALDRDSRRAALDLFLTKAVGEPANEAEEPRLAA